MAAALLFRGDRERHEAEVLIQADTTPETGPDSAMAALQSHRADHQRLSVQCPRSHHVAALYDTGAGLVYTATIGPHSHGSKDFVDTAHHGGRRGREFADLLDAGPDAEDALPAWCDCGARTVSRQALVHALDAERRTLRLG